jgi:alpha-amylase
VYTPPKFTLPRDWQRIIARHAIHSVPVKKIKTLLKNYQLSDDIAFRFGTAHRSGTPLLAETFAQWVGLCHGRTVNLFMDYETFGEHQWADTGIFDFLAALPSELSSRGISLLTPSESAIRYGRGRLPVLDVHAPVSWADTERDLSAWRGNHLQEAALSGIYSLEILVKKQKNPMLLDVWRKLQTSDHFYYLCTKYWADGDVHKYFSPYESPYEAFRRYSHALEDLRLLLAHDNRTSSKKKVVRSKKSCLPRNKNISRHHQS